MSLMSKLLSLATLATLTLNAGMDVDDVTDYIKHHMVKNDKVKVDSVDIIETKALDKPKGWEVYFVNIHANVKKSKTIFDKVTVPETLFVKDGYFAPTLINMETGEDYKRILKPKLKKEVYDEHHLIAGNKDAKHKIVVFSDPQCPFCQTIVPKLYKATVENPKTFALYYYHFPLLRIHPVSDIISRAMVTEQQKGNFKKVIDMYAFKINPREVNATKVLAKLNKKYNLNITEEQINADAVNKDLKFDKEMSTKSMISGTPTIYIDGVWDPSRKKYRTFYDAPKEEETKAPEHH